MTENCADMVSRIVAIVPAAGVGSRMQAHCPKQYLRIGCKTILEHSVQTLLDNPHISRVVIAISKEDPFFHQLPIATDPRISVVNGGVLRADSVLAGMQSIVDASWVLVHDAARPCLRQSDLNKLLQLTTYSTVGGILAVPVKDTMKRSIGESVVIQHTVSRENLWHALTPQLFPATLLKECLQRALANGAEVTDEASALEYCGYHPELVFGRTDNIKVTHPEDLALATFYLSES